MQTTFAANRASATNGLIAAQATSDEMLLEGIAAGEKASMHVLYARHNVRVYRFILRIIGDASVAEDLVSQVFLDVWRTAGQFEGRSQVSTWLLAIARFKALTALRNRKHEDVDQDEVLAIPDTAENPEACMSRSQTCASLRKAVLQRGPPTDRRVAVAAERSLRLVVLVHHSAEGLRIVAGELRKLLARAVEVAPLGQRCPVRERDVHDRVRPNVFEPVLAEPQLVVA